MISSSSNFKDDTFGRENMPSLNFPSSIPFNNHILDSSFPDRANMPMSQNIRKIDITLQYENEKELIKNVDLENDKWNNGFKVAPIIRKIAELGFPVKDYLISYFSIAEKMFVHIGKDPFPEDFSIPLEDIDQNNRLGLKFRYVNANNQSPQIQEQRKMAVPIIGDMKRHDNDVVMRDLEIQQPQQQNLQQYEQVGTKIEQMDANTSSQNQALANATRQSRRVLERKMQNQEEVKTPSTGGAAPQFQSQTNANPQSQTQQQKRTKERTIQDIIEKVSLWRKLYNGVQDQEGNLLRYSLEDAAQKVGVSKKSLDDYLLQLRFGKKFGFDFQKHKDDKVGVLRTFVKKEKSKVNGGTKSKMSSKEQDDSEN